MAFLPAILGKVLKIGSSVLGFGKKAAPIALTIGGGIAAERLVESGVKSGARGIFGGRRKRRGRKALSLNEMGTLMVLGQALGRKSPVVTLAAMKALSGRL